jgi:anaerobic selenocysteine-containing dehydrogenase
VTIDRRRFLGFAIGAAAGSAIGVPGGRVLAGLLHAADTSFYPPKGPETFTLSVCAMCPGGCGVRVRRISERAVKLEGNPLHPVNGGRLCPRGQAALQSLYHPDRITGPLHRVGPRGSIGSFERVPWDRALDEIGGGLRKLREARRPESLVLLRASSRGIGSRGAQRFLEAFGSPNDVVLDRGDEAAALALALTQGVRAVPAYDLASADYVLCMGGALLEAASSPVHAMRSFGRFRQGRTGRRGKLVQVESRLSITGSSADEWIPVRAGTEGVFALGVAGVLVSEGLYNRDFLLERTEGFEDGRGDGAARPGLRTLLARHYGLERVSSQTGVPVDAILRVAREFAAARRSLAVGPRRGPLLPGRVFDHLAVQVLNALVASVDAPGGVLVPEPVPLAPWPVLAADAIAENGRRRPRLDGVSGKGGGSAPRILSDPEQVAEAILTETPYRAEALITLGADPIFTSAAPEKFAKAIERVPLTVSFASLPDDTALACDWILPEAHFLERWELWTTPPGIAYPLASLAQPALAKPLHDVRPAAEIFLALAQRVGPQLEAAFPAKDVPALLQFEMNGLYSARRGAIMGTPFDEAWVRMMEGAGWWAPGYRSAEELWKGALRSGGWWDPFYDHEDWKRVLRTESGRYEFRAELLEPPSEAVEPTPASTAKPEAKGARRSLSLHLFEPLAIAGGTGAELPFLQAILDPGHAAGWETWVEIHPEMGALLGVREGESVRVRSRDGEILARARLTPRVVAGTAAVPVGLGKRGGGRWAAGVGANPLRLVSSARDPIAGLPDLDATAVEIVPAAAGETRPERKV